MNQQNYLNYTLTNDIKLYYKAVAPLSTKFDLSPAGMRGFLQAFFDKASDVNWLMTLTIQVGAIQYDLIKQYGSVTIEDVRLHAMTYMGTMTRHAQNSNQMYACLSESLTPEAKNKVALETHKFAVNNVNDGLLYFKVIVGLAHIDTRATVTVIRTRLSSLDTKIAELQDNIIELNQFVKTQTDGLEARGETTEDLLVNLFKAYKACGDEEFLTWIRRKEDSYNEGTDITPEQLMSLADNKYKTLTESGAWMQKSKSQKRIVALAAQVQSLEKSSTPKKFETKKPPQDKKGKFQGKGKANGKKGGKDKGWVWVTVAPAPGQPTEKDVGGKHFRWCTYHDEDGSGGKWVQHSLADCKIRKELEAKGGTKPNEAGKGKMKVAGMVAVLPEDDDY
jgi:uncharacterized coiled-coil protein SlyX